jgi:hypothetical protein
MNIRMVFPVVAGYFVDYADWTLGGRRVVQVDERKTVHLLLQNGKVVPVLVG